MGKLIERALISVYDKTGIAEFAQQLCRLGTQVISSGGTYKHLKESGISVMPVEKVTGHPEILDGRVKTLHPRIHGGILAKRSDKSHMKALADLDIGPIDCVVVNLYPFREVAADPSSDLDTILENIDIGGPTLLRAAAKNFRDVLVVCEPGDYNRVLEVLRTEQIPIELRAELALKAFQHTGAYDVAISDWFSVNAVHQEGFPLVMLGAMYLERNLRYGENPHQAAALYQRRPDLESFIDTCIIHQGKELSFNNLLDVDGALGLINEFTHTGCCTVLKHTNPVGLAIGDDAKDIFIRAREGDALSAFGGVIAFNIEVDEAAAEEICAGFYEIVIAPSFTDEALKRFKKKKNWRILTSKFTKGGYHRKALEMKDLQLGVLIQTRDYSSLNPSGWKCVTERQPSDDEIHGLALAWRVVKHVKSNAIVIANKSEVLGVGMGQPSRVDSVGIAARKAGDAAKGSCLASDAFFPFPDNVEVAAEAGVRAIVQPGGSLKDQDSIDAANRLGIAMMFTGERHFRH